MAKTVQFCANVNDIPKTLFYVVEQNDGGLTIAIKRSASFFRRNDDGPLDGSEKVIQSRYSIHTSFDDLTGNTFVYQRVIRTPAGHNTFRHYTWTDAVKSKSGFIGVFYKLVPTLGSSYSPKPAKEIFTIGSYNCHQFSLCYAVYISAPEIQFRLYNASADFYAVDYSFQRFRVTVLVSYFVLRSTIFSNLLHRITYRPEEIEPHEREIYRQFTRGQNEGWCAGDFTEIRRMLLEKYVSLHRADLHDHFMRWGGKFFAYASVDTPAYREHQKAMNLHLVLEQQKAYRT